MPGNGLISLMNHLVPESNPLELPVLDVPRLLRQAGLRPDKRLGQNFLIDPVALQRVVESAELEKDDLVLEVGAGLGSLTRYLVVSAHSVTAVELDAHLFELLREVMSPYPNVHLVQGDILKLDPVELMTRGEHKNLTNNYVVAANIPYYITSAVIRHLLEARLQPRRIVLTVQREVAERICAQPGQLSLLALSVQVYGQPQITAQISANSFYPLPEVDSSVVKISLYSEPLIPPEHLKAFFRLVKTGFSQKRKTLRNALAGGMHWQPQQAEEILQNAGIDPQRRAETLSLSEWGKLVEVYENRLRDANQGM